MSKVKQWLEGSVVGTMAAGIGGVILDQAGCNFTAVQWVEILGLLFGGPQAIAAWQAQRIAKTPEVKS